MNDLSDVFLSLIRFRKLWIAVKEDTREIRKTDRVVDEERLVAYIGNALYK